MNALRACRRLMESNFAGPVNIDSEEVISIKGLAELVISISGKRLGIRSIPGPQGVRGRNSDNRLIRAKLGWEPSQPLADGMQVTYRWIDAQVAAKNGIPAMSAAGNRK